MAGLQEKCTEPTFDFFPPCSTVRECRLMNVESTDEQRERRVRSDHLGNRRSEYIFSQKQRLNFSNGEKAARALTQGGREPLGFLANTCLQMQNKCSTIACRLKYGKVNEQLTMNADKSNAWRGTILESTDSSKRINERGVVEHEVFAKTDCDS